MCTECVAVRIALSDYFPRMQGTFLWTIPTNQNRPDLSAQGVPNGRFTLTRGGTRGPPIMRRPLESRLNGDSGILDSLNKLGVSIEGAVESPSPGHQRILCDSACASRVAQALLKVAVWSLIAERLMQLSLVDKAQSGRVGPLEQLGGTILDEKASGARWPETRALLRGIGSAGSSRSRGTVLLLPLLLRPHASERPWSPEMFAKVDRTELRNPTSSSTPGFPCKDREQERRGDEERGDDHPEEQLHRKSMLFDEYAAPVFAHLRSLYRLSEPEYRKSFREDSRMIALAPNSKSPQSFMFSQDGKYLVKTASESELESMLQLLPRYAEHVFGRPKSLMTRFFGIYRITDATTKRSTVYVVSSNVFSTEKRLQERYDIKGSVVGRRASTSKKPTTSSSSTVILKDLDLVSSQRKIRLAKGIKSRFMAELRADAEFLAQQGIMDYSLLVGIHRPTKRPAPPRVLAVPLSVISVAAKPVRALGWCFSKLFAGGRRHSAQAGVYPGREPGVLYYVGIIDVLQRYNLRKIVERGAKGMVYSRDEISAVPPEQYRERFLEFVDANTE